MNDAFPRDPLVCICGKPKPHDIALCDDCRRGYETIVREPIDREGDVHEGAD